MTDNSVDEITRLYFEQKNILIKHQIESYNDYIDNIIPNILSQSFPITINVNNDSLNIHSIKLDIDKLIKKKPYCMENNGCSKILTPKLAILRNYTYSLPLYIDIKTNICIKDNESIIVMPDKIIKNVLLGKIPIMVNSKYCTNQDENKNKYDMGGYMIVNGNEKVIISQEKIAPNTIQVFKNNKPIVKYNYIAEVRSCNENKFTIPKLISVKIKNNLDKFSNEIYVNIPSIKQDIPIFILFRLYGCITDKEIIYNIIDNSNSKIDEIMTNILIPSFEEVSDIRSKQDAFKYLHKYLNQSYNYIDDEKKNNFIKNCIMINILPHLDTDKKKLLYLGYIINKLLKCYLNINKPDDRDSYYHKRIDTPGILMGNLTYLCMNKIVKDIKLYITKEITSGVYAINENIDSIINDINIHRIIKSSYIENILKSSLATGNWGIKGGTNDKAGVSQVLNRLTYLSCISHLRRVSTTADITGKLIPPRKLHATQWGYICPSETPEGQSIGLVKNLSITCEITNQYSSEPIRYILKNYIIPIKLIDIYTYNKNNTKIIINGDWIGFTIDVNKLILILKDNRNRGVINIYTSFYIDYSNNVFYIQTDRGRCCRPLFKQHLIKDIKKLTKKIKNNKDITWRDLLIDINKNESIIEYIDINEVYNILINTNTNKYDTKYTHCEISSAFILGVLASCIPFAHHNQSPRNTYQSAMGKQSIGIYLLNYKDRFDTFSHILYYPQKSIVSTKYMQYFNTNKLPNGINVVVAIASYGGYNQEDSVILNKGSIDRGLFTSTFYRSYKEEEKKNQLTGEEDIFCKPNKNEVLFAKNCNYDKLEPDGFVKPDTYVDENDIIIGKIMPIKNNNFNYKDTSISVKTNENGYVDKNYININGDGFKFTKVRIRSIRVPEIGDKFSSRHGQKGTVGMIYNEGDMPFTKDGIRPDIIVNPHAIPSRMTIAQLLETILGKSCSFTGYNGDATVFNDINIDNISKILESFEYEKHGNEVLYSGITGEQLKTSIFIGPTYYQRLKHLSNDKIHSRASGPVVSMTRQPAEGRALHGGLRFGEMERDCMIAHGSSNFLRERLMEVSDKFSCYVCNMCGLLCISTPINKTFECNNCNNYSKFSKIDIPYSCKLLFQELQCMSIISRFRI